MVVEVVGRVAAAGRNRLPIPIHRSRTARLMHMEQCARPKNAQSANARSRTQMFALLGIHVRTNGGDLEISSIA